MDLLLRPPVKEKGAKQSQDFKTCVTLKINYAYVITENFMGWKPPRSYRLEKNRQKAESQLPSSSAHKNHMIREQNERVNLELINITIVESAHYQQHFRHWNRMIIIKMRTTVTKIMLTPMITITMP